VSDASGDDLALLAQRAYQGDPESSRRLIEAVWPFLVSYVNSLTAVRRLRDEDHVHNIVAAVVDKLSDSATLEAFKGGAGNFKGWVATVAINQATDYMRTLLGRSSKPDQGDAEPSAKAMLNLFAATLDSVVLGERPQFTQQQQVSQVLEAVESDLTPQQREVLRLWLMGFESAAIGVQLGCSVQSAENVRRAGIARLRSRFCLPDLDSF
jgi:RNA polymerase sigma factor (sigma-70 family)